MNRFAFFALAAALALGGCTALDQFPERSNDYSADLSKLDCDYAKALAKINGEPDEVTCPAEPGKTENGATKSTETASKKTTSTATDLALTSLTETANTGANEDQQVRIRNNEIDKRLAVIDANFENFRIALSQENVKADFGVSLVEVGVGGAGALAAETASQILSAVSGGLAGAQAAYSKAALYEKALSALLAQMIAVYRQHL